MSAKSLGAWLASQLGGQVVAVFLTPLLAGGVIFALHFIASVWRVLTIGVPLWVVLLLGITLAVPTFQWARIKWRLRRDRAMETPHSDYTHDRFFDLDFCWRWTWNRFRRMNAIADICWKCPCGHLVSLAGLDCPDRDQEEAIAILYCVNCEAIRRFRSGKNRTPWDCIRDQILIAVNTKRYVEILQQQRAATGPLN